MDAESELCVGPAIEVELGREFSWRVSDVSRMAAPTTPSNVRWLDDPEAPAGDDDDQDDFVLVDEEQGASAPGQQHRSPLITLWNGVAAENREDYESWVKALSQQTTLARDTEMVLLHIPLCANTRRLR